MNSPCIEHLGANRYRCRNMGWTFETTVLPIRCGCGIRTSTKTEAAPARTPAQTQSCSCLVGQYTKQWVTAGKPPELSPEEGERRLRICQKCERFGDGRLANILRMPTVVCPMYKWGAKPLDRYPHTRIISSELMISDARRLLPFFHDVDAVVGISRSGLLPATALAVELHRPLYSVGRHNGVVALDGGRRMVRRVDKRDLKKILLIDDTIARGVIMTAVLPVVKKHFPDSEVITAAIYVPASGLHFVDYCAVEYDMPHYLLYNLWSAPSHCNWTLFDMDGILCEDFLPEDDDDGPRYLAAMKTRKPIWLPRYSPIRIVTARLERYREPTLAWLKEHNIEVGELVMGPWANNKERAGKIVQWKAARYAERKRVRLFVESDPIQAREIASLTKRPVLCPLLPMVLEG